MCNYSAPAGERSITISLSACVCVCLSVREHISGSAGPIFTNFYADPCDRGSVLLWRHCDTLCTSGFMDDVTFSRNGRYDDARKADPQPTSASGVAISGRSLMSINALL